MTEVVAALGLMSGTSMDGIDVALLKTDGHHIISRDGAMTVPYKSELRRDLSRAIAEARDLTDRNARPGDLARIEADITDAHAEAVAVFRARFGDAVSAIDVIGFHGQTVFHAPDRGITIQLGDGQRLANTTGIAVTYDLRANDVAAGGQGAPLAPAYHAALAASIDARPLVVLNIGGVANLTWIGESADDLVAFDTGPGNAYLDDWMAKSIGATRDEGGASAQAGAVDQRVVDFFLSDAYFAKPPPKSLDRNAFFWDMIDGLSVTDGAATLVAMTVQAIARGLDHVPSPPQQVIVCGGGRYNAATMAALDAAVACPVLSAEDAGIDGDAVEAEAWAFLATRALHGLPITYPGTTGVTHPLTGGVVVHPQ